MQISFAASRPSGPFALVLPVAGQERAALGSLGAERSAIEAAAKAQRFEGESGGAAEAWSHAVGGDRKRLER